MNTEQTIISYLCYVLLFLSPIVFISLIWKTSPYGRYLAKKEEETSKEETSSTTTEEEDKQFRQEVKIETVTKNEECDTKETYIMASKFVLPARWAWVFMESPAFYVTAAVFYGLATKDIRSSPVNNGLVWLMLVHYFQRSFIYPLLIRGGKPFPVSTFFQAMIFCALNGYIQGRSLSLNEYPRDWFVRDPRFVIGVCLFGLGMTINIHSDYVLRNLRKPGETGYKIPYGGMFRFVSAANLLGEIIEWWGFAVACWSLPALTFAVFTMSNVVPRGWQHHHWYKEKFGNEYPQERYAIIPLLL